MRAIGVKLSARSTTFPINSSRPKQILGNGGGDSPEDMLGESKTADRMVFEMANLAWVWGAMTD